MLPILFLPPLIAIFWAVVMFVKKRGSGAHRVMGEALLVYVVAYSLFCALFLPASGMAVCISYMTAALTVMPFHYVFFRKAVDVNGKRNLIYYISIVNALVILSLTALTLIAGPDMSNAFYHKVVMGEAIDVPAQYEFAPIWRLMDFIVFRIFGLLLSGYSISLMVWAFVKMVSYDKLLDDYFSGRENSEKKNNLFVFLSLVFTLVPIVLLLARPFYLIRGNVPLLSVCVATSAVAVFLVGFYAFRINLTAEQVRFMIDEDDEKRKLADDVPATDYVASGYIFNETLVRLKKAIAEDRVYLDPNLTLIGLSDKLSTNRTYLSKVINLNYNCSFSEYVNSLRIEYALSIIKERSRAGSSLREVSVECGYANQASFIRNFSKIMGMTPSEYLDSENN